MSLPLTTVFADLPDPRRDLHTKHALVDLLVIATCAVISGAEGWDQVAEYGRRKTGFFQRFLKLENGIPSHDTFGRVFDALDPTAFADRFAKWMASACEGTGLTPIAIDGKSVRGSKRWTATGCLHLVSAWATANGVTHGQVSVADGSNEVAAIPELLKVLDLAGAIVTIDAAGCPTANAAAIRRQGGHDLLAVKDNQPTLHDAVRAVFDRACETDFAGVDHDGHASVEDGHGRHEERSVTVIRKPQGLPDGWTDAAAVIQVNRVREVRGKRTPTTHDYLTSHAGTAKALGDRVRGHWAIESMHWVLDVAFREDASRTRVGHAGANLGMIRKVAVSLLKRVDAKGSIHTRRLMAAWDDEFMLKVIQGIPAI